MHYTLQSGKVTDTITSRCPTCLTVRYHGSAVDLTDITVCCNSQCYDIYRSTLYTLRDKAVRWAKQNGVYYIGEGEAVVLYLEQSDTL